MGEGGGVDARFRNERADAFEGDGGEVLAGGVGFAAADDASDAAAFDVDLFDGGAETEPDVGHATPGVRAVEIAEGDVGHAHLIGIICRQEAEADDLEAVAGGHTVQFFVDGADEDLTPETLDGVGRLAFFAEPVEHGDVVQIRSAAVLPHDAQEGTGDGDFVGQGEERETEERFGEVEWGGEEAAFEDGDPASRLHEGDFGEEVDFVLDSEAAVEVEQVDAAAQEDVLAVIDDFGIGEGVRGGATAEERAGFEEFHGGAGAAQGRGGGEAGKATADDNHVGHAAAAGNRERFPPPPPDSPMAKAMRAQMIK